MLVDGGGLPWWPARAMPVRSRARKLQEAQLRRELIALLEDLALLHEQKGRRQPAEAARTRAAAAREAYERTLRELRRLEPTPARVASAVGDATTVPTGARVPPGYPGDGPGRAVFGDHVARGAGDAIDDQSADGQGGAESESLTHR
jgi:hypothetical protein